MRVCRLKLFLPFRRTNIREHRYLHNIIVGIVVIRVLAADRLLTPYLFVRCKVREFEQIFGNKTPTTPSNLCAIDNNNMHVGIRRSLSGIFFVEL